MKTPSLPLFSTFPRKSQLLLTLAFIVPSSAFAQNLIDTDLFYEPDFKVRRFGNTSGILSLTTNNSPVSGTNSSGALSWTHSAGGHAQVRTQIVVGVPLANLDAQIAGYTQTTGSSLVFGREITTDSELLGVVNTGPTLQGMVNDVAGASVSYSWQSDATVSGLAIVPDQLYQVSFSVTSGAGLPINLLGSASFGITTPGVTGASNESAESLSLLNLFSTGGSASTGEFTFIFQADQNLSALDFSFAAATLSGITGLGGTAPNQNVLTFSGLQVTQIPEPKSATLSSLLVAIMILRRKRIS
jgi:hypothetical protein